MPYKEGYVYSIKKSLDLEIAYQRLGNHVENEKN